MKKLMLCLLCAAAVALAACSSDEGNREPPREFVSAVFSPVREAGEVTDEEFDQAYSAIRERLLLRDVVAEITVDHDAREFTVVFSREEHYDYFPIVEGIGETALLTFHEGYERDKEPFLTGADVVSATADFDADSNEHQVSLEFNESGAQAFSDATARLAPEAGVISIWLDTDLISTPAVHSHITDGEVVITGHFTEASAANLAQRINGGTLPYAFTLEYVDIIER
jgi:preprotein translocase subunit SecD